MIKKLFAAVISIFIFSQIAFTQLITIIGNISDKEQRANIKNVVITLSNSKDSLLYKFTRSNLEGNFSIQNVQSGQYVLMTTHPLFADYLDSIIVTNAPLDLGKILLLNKSKLLQEVIVKNGSPIRIKGDTTVYTADSFKVKDGATVEDLLRKMPGFQVGKDGKIKSMGETVKNVLVDGEEFFGNDPGIALKNLQANIVQEVQVYDKKSDQAAFTGVDDGIREKTVNLKLKSNKKQGYFGKVEAGGGSPSNYSNSAMFNAFQGKRKLSAYGFMSNTGNTDLSWDDADKFGGGEKGELITGTDSQGNNVEYYSGSGEDSYRDGRNGIPVNRNGGLHYSNKYRGDSLSINSSYKYAKVNAPSFASNYSRTFLPDTSWLTNSNSSNENTKEKHSVGFSVENKIDTNNTVKFTNRFNYGQSSNSSNYYEESIADQSKFINNSTRYSNAKAITKSYTGMLTWNHKFKKIRRTFSTAINTKLNDVNANIFLYALNNFYNKGLLFKKDTIDQKTLNKSSAANLSGSLVYTEPLNKNLSFIFNYSINLSNNINNKQVYKKNNSGVFDNLLDSLSNDFNFKTVQQRSGFSLRYVKKKITAGFGGAIANNNFTQKNNTTTLSQKYSFINFFPTANVSVKLKSNKNFRLNYNGYTQAPTLQMLQPIVDNSDALNITKGNTNLKQSFTHNINGAFNWSKPLSSKNFWSYYSFSTTKNDFTQFNIIDTIGRNITQTINTNGNYSLSADMSYNFAIGSGSKKIEIGPSFNFQNSCVHAISAIFVFSKYTSLGVL